MKKTRASVKSPRTSKRRKVVLPPTLTAEERQAREDYEWCLHDPEIQSAYGGKVVIAHRRRIWGVGSTHEEAWTAACKDPEFPSTENVARVVVPEVFIPS